MIITVLGLGFVGLTTALGFCELGHTVYGVEMSQQRRDTISAGNLPFFEPHMDAALERHLNKRFFMSEDIIMSVRNSDFVYYCVGTPYGEDGAADLKQLYSAIQDTLSAIKDNRFRVLVVKSTIPPGTSSECIIPFVNERGFSPGKNIGIANNPEFLREGHCWDDFMECDRVVLGVSDEKSAAMLRELYKSISAPIFTVSLNTGEFIKYLSNTLLATMISFSNEMSLAADVIGNVDIANAFRILHLDKRWNGCDMTSYVYPGCGYGGYCLPKDTSAFSAQMRKKGFCSAMLNEVIRINNDMPDSMYKRIANVACKTQRIGILGLSFKPDSDDVRDTPAAKIISKLIENGYTNILAYDPIANQEYMKYYNQPIEYIEGIETIIKLADVIVITTAWPEFKKVRDMCISKPIVDCRYML